MVIECALPTLSQPQHHSNFSHYFGTFRHPTNSLHAGVFKLFCYILGVSAPSFPVNIAAREAVGDLKDEILKKNPNTLGKVEVCRRA